MKSRVVLALMIALGGISAADAQEMKTRYNPELGAVQVWTGEALSRSKPQPLYPILRLGQSDQINVSFDLIEAEEEQLYHRIRHCNADWTISDMMPIEYIVGFDSDRLEMPVMSVGTLLPYAHYRFSYPNEYSRPLISGNYLIEVYRQYKSEKPLLSIRFSMLENSSVSIIDEQHSSQYPPLPADEILSHQQINLQIENRDWSSSSRGKISLVIVPNGSWDDAITLTHPTMDNVTSLVFDGANAAVFPAGNEYRKIEHLSTFEGGLGIESTIKTSQLVEQKVTPLPTQQSYVYRDDLNGRSFVYSEDVTQEHEIDYHLLTFTLPSADILSGDLVVCGQYFNHYPQIARTLQYDPSQRSYTLTLPIKMGYQEFQYRLVDPSSGGKNKKSYVEGNYSQTTNEYTILVYERKPFDRTDRLVGTKVIFR